MRRPIYVLGTSLSHNGSACLLKDGRICAAIEKERITRVKQDGYNDTAAINYCLDKEGIRLEDVSLVVQNSPVRSLEKCNHFFEGPRLFGGDHRIPVVTISHHVAHAYSAIGTGNFKECAILVIDGSGNALEDCIDLEKATVSLKDDQLKNIPHYYRESDSYYHFNGKECAPVFKNFSPLQYPDDQVISTYTEHSIGDVYGAVSKYCFNNMHDAGKLMGLAPYGNAATFNEEIFQLKDGVVTVNQHVLTAFNQPSRTFREFKRRFQYYADIANWVQRELERAILYIINSRYEMSPSENLAYAGGVALNAVVNGKILKRSPFKRLYIQPAAGDNGVSLGCAFYGWMEILKKERVEHSASTCFGKIYDTATAMKAIHQYHTIEDPVSVKKAVDQFFTDVQTKGRLADPGKNFLVQFNVKDAGIYQVRAEDGQIESKNDILGTPTSEVSITASDLYRGISNPEYLDTLLSGNGMMITSEDQYHDFIRLASDAFGRKAQGQSPVVSADEFIHHAGKGYIEETARLLAEGKIIGWFQDESEFGPRALGRRSILADPRTPGARDFINAEIKFREDFRPFAPSVLLEDVSLYFDTDIESPYMITVSKVRPVWKDKIRNVVHEDDTCRIQTVTPEWNFKYWSLLHEFKRMTGLSVLLNTSLNRKGMPIVETPEDALAFFYACKLDYMVIQDIIVKKKGRRVHTFDKLVSLDGVLTS